MKVLITGSLTDKKKALHFTLNLMDNNFPIKDNKYNILGTEIEVDNKLYRITEFEKIKTAHPIEWNEKKPIAITVEKI